jgi:signal transduction histidine kinase
MEPLPDPTSSRRWREQAERLLDCLGRALRHELPNQLVAILGLARLLIEEQGSRLDLEGRYHLDRLIALSRRADGLVRALADIVRFSLKPEPATATSLAEAAREAAAEVNLLFSDRPIKYHLQEVLPVLTVAPPALRQVLVQLFCNAAQAAAPDRSLRIEVGARQGPAGVEFWVADNGCGLAEDQREGLFDPFARGSAPPNAPGRAEDYGASCFGLGLFLVRQIVAGWGGSIRVQSEPGGGARFTLLVPHP